MIESLVGAVAAFCTTFGYLPQVIRSWRTRSTGDLSLGMILTVTFGVALWLVYGVLRSDPILIAANAVALVFLLNLLAAKLLGMARRPP